MYITAQDFIQAIREAQSSEEIINIWTEAARGDTLSMKDIISIHQACGKLLLNAVHENHEREQQYQTKISNV
jgi:hypothetical protein